MQDLLWIGIILALTAASLGYFPVGGDARRRGAMTIDLWLAAITAAGLLIYLVAVLARPERF